MKRIESIWIVVTLVLAVAVMAGPTGSSPSLSNHVVTTNGTSTFYGVTNHSWYALKIFSPKAFTIEKLAFNFTVKCEHCRENPAIVVITNGNDKQMPWIVSTDDIAPFNETDRFLHFKFGPINYTKQHWTWHNVSYILGGFYPNIRLGPGTWYVICLHAKSVTSQIELSLTCSEGVEFQGTTCGNDTFLFASQDFWGNVNVKVPGVATVLGGQKTIRINHTFVGSWFSNLVSWGLELIKCTRPDGTQEHSMVIEMGSIGGTFGDFDARFIMGGSGTWTFGLNMFVLGMKNSKNPFPYCSLLGADVKLP